MNNMILPLECLAHGEKAVVEDVQGEPGWVCRMAELGIRNGSHLEIVQPGSPCLLEVSGCRLCVRGDDSMRIFVRPVT